MSTSHTPGRKLKAEAAAIAKNIKAIERGENPVGDLGGRMSDVRNKEAIKFAVVMDDKIITISMLWSTIKECSEAALAAMILKHMRGAREH